MKKSASKKLADFLPFGEKIAPLPRKRKIRQIMSEATLSTKPYTMEEINARIAQSERDSAEGRVCDFDDAFRELENQI